MIFKDDKHTIYYEVHGNQTSPKTLVFLNGVMASVDSWYVIMKPFLQDYRVVLHDFLGQMHSDKPPGPYTFKSHADTLYELLNHLNIYEVNLIGTSYGGEVAIQFASLYPSFTERMVLISSASETDAKMRTIVQSWKSLAQTENTPLFLETIVATMYSRSFIERHADTLQKRIRESHYDRPFFQGQIALYDTFLQNLDLTGLLPTIQAKTLVVVGDEDILKPPRFSKLIAEKLPNAFYVEFKDCGHVTIFEKPKELIDCIHRFFENQTLEI